MYFVDSWTGLADPQIELETTFNIKIQALSITTDTIIELQLLIEAIICSACIFICSFSASVVVSIFSRWAVPMR